MTRIVVWVRSVGRWITRVCTPSAAGWAGATWALVAVWGLLVIAFLGHEVAPQFSVGKLAGLLTMVGALAERSPRSSRVRWASGRR